MVAKVWHFSASVWGLRLCRGAGRVTFTTHMSSNFRPSGKIVAVFVVVVVVVVVGRDIK